VTTACQILNSDLFKGNKPQKFPWEIMPQICLIQLESCVVGPDVGQMLRLSFAERLSLQNELEM